LPSVLGFWAVGEDFFPDSRIFLLGKIFFANSLGLGCWKSSELLAKPQFPGWFVLREKYWWLVADKPNEQGVNSVFQFKQILHHYSSRIYESWHIFYILCCK
jgi:hypothetical protein